MPDKKGSHTSPLDGFGAFELTAVPQSAEIEHRTLDRASEAPPLGGAPGQVRLRSSPERAPGTSESVGILELLGFSIRLLPDFKSTTIVLSVDGQECLFTNSKRAYDSGRSRGLPVFVGGEYVLIAYAAQNERVWAPDFREYIARKRRNNGWRLTPPQALGKVYGLVPLTWNLGQVLRRVDARLVGWELG